MDQTISNRSAGEESRSAIQKPAALTTTVQDRAGKTLDVLQHGFHGRIVNGYSRVAYGFTQACVEIRSLLQSSMDGQTSPQLQTCSCSAPC
jgi:hypothetical protein